MNEHTEKIKFERRLMAATGVSRSQLRDALADFADRRQRQRQSSPASQQFAKDDAPPFVGVKTSTVTLDRQAHREATTERGGQQGQTGNLSGAVLYDVSGNNNGSPITIQLYGV